MEELKPSPKPRVRRSQEPGVTEVAQAAGVSIATVSRVLNQPQVVSAKTRERVQAAMKELNFHLNPAASALRRGHGNVVTILAASLAQPWYTKLMRALKVEIEARGFTVMLVDLQHDPEVLRQALLPNSQHLPTGMVLATGDLLADAEIIDAIQAAHSTRPVVVIGQHVPDAEWPTVQFTDEEWAYQATREMLKHSASVAFLGTLEGSYLASERLAGYLRAAREAGLDESRWVWPIEARGYAAGFEAVRSRIEQSIVPGAILAINDELALGASRALLTRELRIPEDVAVMGFGNTDFLEYVTPTLSSVDGSAVDAARVAIDALWAQFDEHEFPRLTVLERTIVHRESTRGDIGL